MKQAMHGYILPATVLLGLGTTILAATFAQIVTSSSQTLNTQTYNQMAEEAATAGAVYANSCAMVSVASERTAALTPASTCSGGSGGYVYSSANLRTKFSVAVPDPSGGRLSATSTGTVEQHIGGGQWVTAASATKKVAFTDTTTSIPTATGRVITDLSSETHSCAIANGELYCWGYNDYGELGIGNTTDQASPVRVAGGSGQAFYNKVVTKVAVGNANSCAIANGELYCWGRNEFGQLGIGNTSQRTTPTLVGGALTGKKVTDVYVTQGTAEHGDKSACAIADGIPYCWGSGRTQQLGQRAHDCYYFLGINPTCVDQGGIFVDTTSYRSPRPLWGYRVPSDPNYASPLRNIESDSPLYQRKVTSIAIGSTQASAIADGYFYNWGNVLAPLWPPVLVHKYDGPFASRAATPESIVSIADISCGIGHNRLICYGQLDALTEELVPGYPQEVGASPGDIQSHDGSKDARVSLYTNDLYCILTTGATIYCSGRGPYTGTGHQGPYNFHPLQSSSGMAGKIATKVAVGVNYGCFIANGSLLCWGRADGGQLGNGILSYTTPGAQSILSGNGVIGTTAGAAATGPLSVGDNHACGVANGQLYCWGRNNSNQLGTGNATDQYEPTSVAGPLASRVVTKVSAGAAHTCAVSDGQLYCWGSNANGRTGLNTSSGTQTVPGLVGGALAGKRVTDVSAGATSTCAIANSQAYCWGNNTDRQLGVSGGERTLPVLVASISNPDGSNDGKSVTAITVGTTHACAIMNGDGYCWGDQSYGQLGNGTTATGNVAPTRITGGTAGTPISNYLTPTFTDISAGSNFTCAVINSIANCWGHNGNNRTGRSGNSNTPGVVTGASGMTATAISAGSSHACAVLNGRTYCWGNQADGRLGNSTSSGNQMSANLINQGDNNGKAAISVAAGGASTCNVAAGTIQCWGLKANGRLGIGTNIGNGGNAAHATWPTTTNNYRLSGAFSKGIIY